ncbi:hypothetical protein Tco_0190196 [Tanacetum coccineum]
MESVKKLINERALHKREYDSRVNDRLMQTTEGKVDTSKELDASLADTKSSGIKSGKQDTSSSSGNDADADDADIKPVYDEEPMAKTGRIFKTVGLRWVPAGKIFTFSTTKVDSEPPRGSNTDITNPYECIQNLDSSAGTSKNVQEEQNLDLSTGTPFNLKTERIKACIKENMISERPRLHGTTLIQEISA